MPRLKTWEEGKPRRAHTTCSPSCACGAPPCPTLCARILAKSDLEQLQRWLENTAVAASMAQVIDDPR